MFNKNEHLINIKKSLDKNVNKMYKRIMEKKYTNGNNSKKGREFRKLIDENRAKLRDAGYPDATVSRWASGQRVPSLKSASKLAYDLGVTIDTIPYRINMIL